jgi:hypothetical protein
MNYLMSGTRIGIGLISGLILLLLTHTIQPMKEFGTDLAGVAILGLVGGFTERLVPIILRGTASKIASSAGTPVQAI